ncbi:hypothetical protein HAX54_032570 [Datura stramonium]|uniref:Uncharacterized protein n=1 Tax=Datura stramonium TaxID=4076 RepID=A0ABS8VBV3_DATST|nr:hypothetical protein [Datura stramonium]
MGSPSVIPVKHRQKAETALRSADEFIGRDENGKWEERFKCEERDGDWARGRWILMEIRHTDNRRRDPMSRRCGCQWALPVKAPDSEPATDWRLMD